MIRTRSLSRGRRDSNRDIDPLTGITRRGSRHSLGSHDPRSPIRPNRRHSESRMEYGSGFSGVEDERVQISRQYLYLEKLLVNVSQTFDVLGKKIQVTACVLLELILNCIVDLVLRVRMKIRSTSSPYDRSAARIDVLSFLWAGFWSLVVTLFFIPPDPEINVVRKVVRFTVGTFQTTGLLFGLFFMLYLHKMTN